MSEPLGAGASRAPYAAPIDVASIDECYYYHTMEVPGHGLVRGEWDLRAGLDAYLGGEPVRGKRVLEVGTASGFVCFEMERRGADVVAYDLGPNDGWDTVPYEGIDRDREARRRGEHITRLNKSWWFNHRAFGSRANAVYGTVYAIPASIGAVDIVTFGSVLLHVRDPLAALQRAAALRPHTIIVTEPARRWSPRSIIDGAIRRRSPLFLPDGVKREPVDGWWSFSPEAVSNLLAIVGYAGARTVRHTQLYEGRRVPMFTVVARR